MNIAELLEFVNLLKKKLNYAGSNICSRVTGNGVLIDYEGQIIPIDIFIGYYSIAICFDIDDETERIVDEMAKWEYGDMKEFWRVNMSKGEYWHFKVDYYGLSFNRDFKGWNGVGVYVCWTQAYEKAKLGVYIRDGKYVVQKGFNPTIPGDKVYEQAKEKVVRLPNHVKF